jgi:hypothetical protein
MGVQLNYYGTGLLGFGTSLFDPILPVRFLADPAFVLITQNEVGGKEAGTKEVGDSADGLPSKDNLPPIDAPADAPMV